MPVVLCGPDCYSNVVGLFVIWTRSRGRPACVALVRVNWSLGVWFNKFGAMCSLSAACVCIAVPSVPALRSCRRRPGSFVSSSLPPCHFRSHPRIVCSFRSSALHVTLSPPCLLSLLTFVIVFSFLQCFDFRRSHASSFHHPCSPSSSSLSAFVMCRAPRLV